MIRGRRALSVACASLLFLWAPAALGQEPGPEEGPRVVLEGLEFDPDVARLLRGKRPDLRYAEATEADYRIVVLTTSRARRRYPRNVEVLVEGVSVGHVLSAGTARCRFREDLVRLLAQVTPVIGRWTREKLGGRPALEVPLGVTIADGEAFFPRTGLLPDLAPGLVPWRAERDERGSLWLRGTFPNEHYGLCIRVRPDRAGRARFQVAGNPPLGASQVLWEAGGVRGVKETDFRRPLEVEGLPRGHQLTWEVQMPGGLKRQGQVQVPRTGFARVQVEAPVSGLPFTVHLDEGAPEPGAVEVYVDGRVPLAAPARFNGEGILPLRLAPGTHQVRLVPEAPGLLPVTLEGLEPGMQPRVRFEADLAPLRARAVHESAEGLALVRGIVEAAGWRGRGGGRQEPPQVDLATLQRWWAGLPEADRTYRTPLWIAYLRGPYAALEDLGRTHLLGPDALAENALDQAEGLLFLQVLLASAPPGSGVDQKTRTLVHLHLVRLLFEEPRAEQVSRYDGVQGLSRFANAYDATTGSLREEAYLEQVSVRPYRAADRRACLLRALAFATFIGEGVGTDGLEPTLEWTVRWKAMQRQDAALAQSPAPTTYAVSSLSVALPRPLRHPAFDAFQ